MARPLSADRIEEAALALIEREGIAGFSFRKLAAVLHCEAMSIYHYFPSKQHLMDALVDRVLRTMPAVDDGVAALAKLRQIALDLRAMALRFPRFFQYLAYHRLNTPGGVALLNRILAAIGELKLGTEMSARIFRAVGYYVTGAALDETAGYSKGFSAAVPVTGETIEREYPLVAAVNPYFQPPHHEKTFLLGLAILLDGIASIAGVPKLEVDGKTRPRNGAAHRRKRSSA